MSEEDIKENAKENTKEIAKENAKIEMSNAKEEIQEILEKCNRCGLCKELDPVYRISREEALSPRGRTILFSKKIYDSSVFEHPLCGQCAVKCPFALNIDKATRLARKILNLKNKEHPVNQKILSKIENKQNPFQG